MRFWLGLLSWPLLSAAAVLGVCVFIPPTYTAVATLVIQPSARGWGAQALPPVLPSLAQYGALLQSRRVADRVIDQFALQAVYGEATREDTRERLAQAVQFGGTKGGLLIIQASDRYPWRAADLANQFAAELQRLLDELRVTQAHIRADRLNAEVERLQQRVAAAHTQLRASRLDAGDLQLEPRLAAGSYVALQQAAQASTLRLAGLRTQLQEGSADVQRELALAGALHVQLEAAEAGRAPVRLPAGVPAYADAQRELRLLEPLLKTVRVQAMQAEMDAGIRDEALLRVDLASIPERPSGPFALGYMAAAWLATLGWLLLRRWRQRASGGNPFNAATSRA